MDLNRPNFGINHHLVIAVAPLQNLFGKKLIEAGVLPAGAYECWIETSGLSAIDVYLEPTAATSGGTPTLASYSLQVNPAAAAVREGSQARQTVTYDTAAGSAFTANTIQKLSLTGLNGTNLCKVTFTVTTSLDFTPATTHGRAEVRGL